MFANRMSLQMLKQLFDKVFTNSFPVQGMPDDLGAALKLAEEGEIQLNPPIEPNPVERRFRGRVDYDKAKCIGCKLCIKVCPANAISYVEDEKKIEIHADRCCFCAQCTEVCPVNCLAMSDTYLFSSYDRKAEVVNDSGNFDIKLENIIKSSAIITEESTAEKVPETEVEAANEKEAPAQAKYEIDEEKCIGCTKCARICPVDAITGEPKKPHVIDKETCIACGQCADSCPVDAIHIEGEQGEVKKEAAQKPEDVKEPEGKEAAGESTPPEKKAGKKTAAKKTTKKTTKPKEDSE